MSQGFQFKPEAPNIAKHREYVLKYFKKRLGTALGNKNAKRRRRKFCVLVCTKKNRAEATQQVAVLQGILSISGKRQSLRDKMIYIHTYISLHYITLHYVTLHYITLHCIALHCIALHCVTLHYIHTYTHMHIKTHTYRHTHIHT